jgi:methionine aminotransferase
VIRSKLPATGTTIFSVMSALAQQHQAINLGQGFPGFPVDPELIEAVHRAMLDGHNQYAPMPGWLPLREALADKLQASFGCKLSPADEITITAGATQALFTCITAFIRPGDEVILFAPAYDCYAPAIELNGGVPVWIHLEWPDYSIPWEQVEARFSQRTRMIIFNTPSNPAGTIWTREDILRLLTLTAESDCIVLSDEVYEHLVFDGHRHESVLRYGELAKRCLAIYSFGKTFHATGWKMGYAAGPAALMSEFRKVHQYNVFSCHSAMQVALAAYLGKPEHYDQLSGFFQRKRDLFLSELEGSRFSWKPARGAYFQLLCYSGLTTRPDREVAEEWTRSPGVASIPVSVFYPEPFDQHVLRFCFAKEDDMLVEAARRLKSIST